VQIVYISNRPDVLNDTLRQIDRFCRFIDRAVIACPDSCRSQIDTPARINTIFVSDKHLLNSIDKKLDHQSRNFHLRRALVGSDVIDDEFIMSDDDARPIRPLEKSLFMKNSKYQNYYFYDLEHWPRCGTEFDQGQISTFAALKACGYETRAYASHMPQIINRDIYLQATERFNELSQGAPLCEWSVYFNFARGHYPDQFAEPSPFVTLCWPDLPHTWPLFVQPGTPCFENYYAHFYHRGGIFYGLEPCPDMETWENSLIKKLRRWQQVAAGRQEGKLALHDPWRRNPLIRLAVSVVAPLRKILPDKLP
jgi:hypothetical protein